MDDHLQRAKSLLDEAYQLVTTDIGRARQLSEEVQQIIPASIVRPPIEKFQADLIIAEWHRQRGQYAEAVVRFLGAINYYKDCECEEDDWLIFALYRLGMVYTLINYHTDALELHWRQYNIAQKFDNHTQMGNALRRIGWAYHELQQTDRAIEHHLKSLAEFQIINNISGIAGVYNNLALIYQHLEDITLAIDYAQKSVTMFEAVGYLRGQMLAHGTLTSILIDAGDLEAARKHGEYNLALAKQLNIHHNIIQAHLNVGKLYNHMGDTEKAFEYYDAAYTFAYEQQDIVGQKLSHQHLTEFYKNAGDFAKALEHQELFHQLEINTIQNATQARIEVQTVLHQTKQAQAELVQQKLLRQEERNHYQQLTRMKDELISTASHDLKNPLTSIKTITYLLSKHLAGVNNDKVHELINNIDESVEQMRDLIVNVLDLARLETGKTLEVKRVELATYLQSILDEFSLIASHKNIAIAFDDHQTDIYTSIDPPQIQQVIRNLLSNAVKYTQNGGKVDISIQQKDEQIIIIVQDTGIGIPEADIPFVFERFYRVKNEAHQAEEGTGLGLAICKSIVERHQGTITVESIEGKGSTFLVSLPITM